VSSGIYTLVASSLTGGGATNPIRVAVADKPITDLAIQLLPTHVLSGRVIWKGEASPKPPLGRVVLNDARVGLGARTAGGAINPDNAFKVDAMFPGHYYFSVDPVPDGWALASATITGRDLVDSGFDYDGSGDVDDVTIEMTNTANTVLRGTLTDSSMRPSPDCTIVVFPEDEHLINRFSRRVRASQSSADGVFLIRGLPAGDYLVAVVDDIENGAWLDPAVLKTMRPAATRVHLNENEQKSIALRFAR
jgi:hypothetical protein